MEISLAEAEGLIRTILERQGWDPALLDSPVAHLIDSELRGLDYAGFARVISIADRLERCGRPTGPMQVRRETPVSALVDGADHLGYIVGQTVTDIAIAKAETSGIAVVGGKNTWYTGMLSFYAEQAVARGLVTLIFSNAAPWVAPHGGTEGRFGTNPICAGFPAKDAAVIWDIGTSDIIHAQVTLAGRLGLPLPEGVAYDAEGNPTVDPAKALAGAFTAWGGHRGSGLAIVVQLMGILAGSDALLDDLAGFGMVMIVMRPDLLRDPDEFADEVSRYAEFVRATRPLPGGEAEEARLVAELRAVLAENMPGVARAILALDRSAREANELADAAVARLGGSAEGATPAAFEEVRDYSSPVATISPTLTPSGWPRRRRCPRGSGLATAYGSRRRPPARSAHGIRRRARCVCRRGSRPVSGRSRWRRSLPFSNAARSSTHWPARPPSAAPRRTGWCASASPTTSRARC